jgi:Tol biopolymer transport system component
MPRDPGKRNLGRGPARAALALSALALAVPRLGSADGRFIPNIFLRDRQTGLTERVSVDGAGAEANDESWTPAISADGRHVAFQSFAPNLVPNDTNGAFDIFLRDRQTGTTERVNLDSAGGEANGWSFAPALSADGRYVAFQSWASNLVPNDVNGWTDIFLRDRRTGVTERVSLDNAGGEANEMSEMPALSADGRHVAFVSWASNLVPNDTNGWTDIFLRDRQTGTTERLSLDSAGGEANAESWTPAISADGRYVAFVSRASNLVPNDTNGMPDIFLRDRQTGTTERVSVDSAGGEANGWSSDPAISADGRHVAFASQASNLVPNDTNGLPDIFLRDRQTGTTERLSLDGAESGGPAISADGRYVAFHATAWVDVYPVAQTTLSAPARAGATTLALASPDGFMGKVIVIAEGATSEETNLVTAKTGRGRLRLARPLRFAHPLGTPVAARSDTLFLSTNRATIRPSANAVLRGRLWPLPGGAIACGQAVRIEFAGFAQRTLPAADFRRRGSRCLYEPEPRWGGRLDVSRFSYDFVRGSFRVTIVNLPHGLRDNPARFALAIGQAAGKERLRMEEPRPGFWRYRYRR